MKNALMGTLTLIVFMISVTAGRAFCGFYVAKADAKLFNNRSEVIMVRDGKRNVITMSSDYNGALKDFAMVVPVPVVLKEQDIRVVNRRVFDALNDYSAPRLVEYYDQNPCYVLEEEKFKYRSMMANADFLMETPTALTKDDLGVTIEAQYQIGEYDILILSAVESVGLKTWLTQNGYQIPSTAEEVLDPYIKSNMKFFVVKVNLEKAQNTSELSPIQLSFEHDKFMLPLRLGMANSQGSQDMIVYAFTRTGRVECTNYRTVKMPTDRNIPLFVQSEFGSFYKSIFEKQYLNEGRNAVFLEYAWNVSPFVTVKCDPCVGPPPVNQDFADAGIWWLNDTGNNKIFFTRLHVRYTRDKFPVDLQFQVTPNDENFQCRYILTHPATGGFECEEGQAYLEKLYNLRRKEVDEMYALASWRKGEQSANYIKEYNSLMKTPPADKKSQKNEAPFLFPDIDKPSGPSPMLLVACLVGMVLLALRFSKGGKLKSAF